ncbi:MAG: hypothetical protein MRY64_11915 [Hyphomonadaceae bacterium]|nr:hypothetical protein [Hyphomonadaceae bacterium]
MIRTSILGACALFVAGPALAGTLFTANLSEPVAERTTFVANSAVWTCVDNTCVAELDRRSPTVRSCKKVAEEIGSLASFSSERGELDEADLARCNEVVDD